MLAQNKAQIAIGSNLLMAPPDSLNPRRDISGFRGSQRAVSLAPIQPIQKQVQQQPGTQLVARGMPVASLRIANKQSLMNGGLNLKKPPLPTLAYANPANF